MARASDKQLLLLSTSPGARPAAQVEPPISDLPVGVSRTEWDRAWTFLAPAVARSGEHTQASVLKALKKGTKKLWVRDECAAVTNIMVYPSGLTVGLMWLLGGRLEAILDLIPRMEDWMRANGATESRIIGRPGWAKVTGYKPFRIAIRKDLR